MSIEEKENDSIMKVIKLVDRLLVFVLGCIISFGLGIFAGVMYEKRNTSTPVDNRIIDSLTTVNDSIKIKIEKLDSIKDAKIIEVSTLDNDSTLKLFYKLVSE